MSRKLTLPSARLQTAAKMAAVSLYKDEKKSHCAIDVGCDHAKLAVYLVQSGLCEKVYATDINDGPVNRAKQTLQTRSYMGKPLADYIEVFKNDGLCGMENSCADRIFILGMGGELISGILDRAQFLRLEQNKEKVGLILQAMTSADELRKYLYEAGFEIRDEELVLDKDRVYSVMLCVFDGVKKSASKAQYLLGAHNIQKGGELFQRELLRRIRITKAALEQLSANSKTDEHLSTLYKELLALKEEKGI